MKAHRKSAGQGSLFQSFEFKHRRPPNVLTVENHATGVRIRAARANFSRRDKEFFVRHLATEGFIPDGYRWFSGDCEEASCGIQWCVKGFSATNQSGNGVLRSARLFMVRLLACVSILWLIELTCLLLTGL